MLIKDTDYETAFFGGCHIAPFNRREVEPGRSAVVADVNEKKRLCTG